MNIQDFILSLITDGAPAMVISGWIAAKLTQASGVLMNVQTVIVAVLLTLLYSLIGWIPIPIEEVWTWLVTGLSNGVIAMLLYKSGIFNNILAKVGAQTAHQLEA